MENLSTIQSLE